MGAHFWMAKIRERQDKPALARKLYQEVAKAQYWYYTARAKAILGITRSRAGTESRSGCRITGASGVSRTDSTADGTQAL